MPHEETHPHDGTTDSGGKLINSYVQEFIDIEESAVPATPAANHIRVHAVDDNNSHFLQVVDEDGNVVRIQRDVAVFVCKNVTGVTIAKGKLVYVSGMTSGIPTIALAKADSSATMPAIGIVTADILNNGFGKVLGFGRLSNFDTSAFSVSDQVWVSETVAGAMKNSEPIALGTYVQFVGHIAVSNATTGSLIKEAGGGFARSLGLVDLYDITASGSYTKTQPNGTEQAEVSMLEMVIPANKLYVGSVITIQANGVVSVNSNQPKLDFRLRIGTNAAFLSNAAAISLFTFTSNSTTNAGWKMDGVLRVKSLGGAGTGRGQLAWFTEMNSQLTFAMELSNETTDATLVTTSQLYVDLTADWSQHGTNHVFVWDAAQIRLK